MTAALVAVMLMLAVVLAVVLIDHARERREWAAERRGLVDRAIARHSGEVIGLDRAAARNDGEREHAGRAPIEGLE